MLVIPAIGTGGDFSQSLSSLPVPVVVASRHLFEANVPYVGIDNIHGGRLAMEHLASHGVHQFGFLGGFDELGPRGDRIIGIKSYLEKSGCDAQMVLNIPGPPHGRWGLET